MHIWGFSKLRAHESSTGIVYVGNDRYCISYIYVQVSYFYSYYTWYIEGSKNPFFPYFLKIMCYPLNIFNFFLEIFSCINSLYLHCHSGIIYNVGNGRWTIAVTLVAKKENSSLAYSKHSQGWFACSCGWILNTTKHEKIGK